MADLTIQYLVVRPRGRSAAWPADRYPWNDLLDLIEQMPDHKREQNVGVGRRATAVPKTFDAGRVLSVHHIDVAARRTEARRGAISVTEFPDTGGPTSAAHLTHLEADVFGIAREPNAPAVRDVTAYIGVTADAEYEMDLFPIKRGDAKERLQRMTTASTITVAMMTSPLRDSPGADRFTQALKAANDILEADELTIKARILRRSPSARSAWFTRQKDELEGFLDGDRAAIVEAQAGNERLLDVAVTATAHIGGTRGAVDADVALDHIRSSYFEQYDEIQESLGRRPE